MLQTMAHRRLGSSFSWSRSSGTAAGSSAAAAARRRRAPPSAAAAAANAAAAAAAAAQPPKTEERVDAALADWIRANGGAVDGAELVYTCDAATGALRGRQLRASKALKPGDRVIRVPRALQVRDDDDAGGDAKLAALMRRAPKAAGGAPDGRVAWQFKMALRLVAYRLEGAASSRAPYVASLPGVADGVPVPLVAMRMAPGDLEALQNPRLAADAAAQAHFSADFADSVLASLPGSPDADPFGGQRVDRDLLKWGLALAMSRSFGFRRSPGHGMVPLVDMADHSFESNAEIRADDDGTVNMIANRDVPAGAPLLLRYGTHGNSDLLLSYGFVADLNPFETVSFGFDADFVLGAVQQFLGLGPGATPRPSDGLKTWQRTLLTEMGLLQQAPNGGGGAGRGAGSSGGKGDGAAVAAAAAAAAEAEQQQAAGDAAPPPGPATVPIGGDPPVSPPLLAALRLMLSEDRKACKARAAAGDLGAWSKPLSAAHEALVMKALVGVCTVLYKGYPTTIQQDAALLAAAEEADAAAGGGGGGSSGGDSGGSGGTAAAAAPVGEGALLAVRYRLAAKRALEAAMRRVLVRMKELAEA